MANKRAGSSMNTKGRNKQKRFVLLPHSLLKSPAYRSLSCVARCLLTELAMLDNGSNNGSLFLGVRDGAGRLGLADLKAAQKAFDELTDAGFIQQTQESHFHIKASEQSRARCWRLTWLTGPGRRSAKCEFMHYQPPPETPAYKRMERGRKAINAYYKQKEWGKFPVLDSRTIEVFDTPEPVEPVLESSTPNHKSPGFPPIAIVRESTTHTAATMGDKQQQDSHASTGERG